MTQEEQEIERIVAEVCANFRSDLSRIMKTKGSLKEGDLTTEQQLEMMAHLNVWKRRAELAEAALTAAHTEAAEKIDAYKRALIDSEAEAAELRKMMFQQGENAATAAKEYAENMAATRAKVAELKARGLALVAAIHQMVEDTTPMFAEMQMRRGPYTGKQIGEELEAFRQALGGVS